MTNRRKAEMTKILIDRATVEQALLALWAASSIMDADAQQRQYDATAALRQALEQAQSEPVAWRYQDARGNYRYRGYVPNFDVEYKLLKPVPLYTHPAPVQQNPAKDHEVAALVNRLRHIATVYHDHQSLRERIAQEIRPMFAAPTQHEEIDPDSRTISVYPVQQAEKWFDEAREQRKAMELANENRLVEKRIAELEAQNKALVEALKLAEEKLVELEHAVGGGDDEIYVEGAILTVRAAIAAAEGK